jgi:transposase InsO family protein
MTFHRTLAWSKLLPLVLRTFEASGRSYGSPRLTHELARRGVSVGRRRVIAAMQALGLQALRGRKPAGRGNRKNGNRIRASPEVSRCCVPDLLRRGFAIGGLDEVWVTDVSLLGWSGRASALCVVSDLASRRVIAWRFGSVPNSALVTSTLRLAFRFRRPAPGLIVHSDRGGEYANHEVRALLERHQARQSMSRRGNCWDNAVAESFFATLKRECLYLLGDIPKAMRVRAVSDYIHWYNHVRLHSTLGYRSPVEFEFVKVTELPE